MVKLMKHIWCDWAHSPEEARTYAMKGDETLVCGPFEWGARMQQGARTDLDAVANLVLDGLNYRDIVRTGLHHTTCAKYERYIILLTYLRDNPVRPPVQWPIHIFNQTVEQPDPKKKKRHLWVAGKTNMGKTYECVKKLGANNICYFGGKKKNMWEKYNNQPVVIFDDVSVEFVEITMLTNTIPWENNIETRYTAGSILSNNKCIVIVLSNHSYKDMKYTFEHKQAIHARFILVDLRHEPRVAAKVEAGYKVNIGEENYDDIDDPICPVFSKGPVPKDHVTQWERLSVQIAREEAEEAAASTVSVAQGSEGAAQVGYVGLLPGQASAVGGSDSSTGAGSQQDPFVLDD